MEYRENDKRFKYKTQEEKRQALRDSSRKYRESHRELCIRRSNDWKVRNKDKVKENRIKYSKTIKYKLNKDKQRKKYAVVHSDRDRATRKLRWAVECGKVIKPNQCSVCQKTHELSKIQGHHNDYEKPYEVIWVCRNCHMDIHYGRLRN